MGNLDTLPSSGWQRYWKNFFKYLSDALWFHSKKTPNTIIVLVVTNRVKLKRFQRTTPRILLHPLWGLTVMCQNSCLQYLPTPAPFLPLREPRWEESCDWWLKPCSDDTMYPLLCSHCRVRFCSTRLNSLLVLEPLLYFVFHSKKSELNPFISKQTETSTLLYIVV